MYRLHVRCTMNRFMQDYVIHYILLCVYVCIHVPVPVLYTVTLLVSHAVNKTNYNYIAVGGARPRDCI